MDSLKRYNVHSLECPARLFFETLADKWVLLIITTLEKHTQHFNLLKKNIEGISPKVLSQKLKHLERDGFIKRTVLDTSPVRVEYALTAFGKEFAHTAYQMKHWAENNIHKVITAQQEYDTNLLN
ncbi:winged helix-turn-helix transcriptional regulator [Acinetobacter rathckeae]|uniref:winged helix-turn-helix transcriptional regulator n=1 Tax=Acinetobacter rathckeae TaxID=2605272 RepID=UPI0018A25E73|nr:helix-turn-helix domain-containing protein [Acinetobacter rathckeae]MBF7686842.1 helix-turn-helix transcriptional regulator [Acinetobacter rathckeae]MBF7695626.1 helix-turn-helix transcriptional regulator [Acinetobacter rathckeae]